MSLVTPWNAARFILKHTVAALIIIGGAGLLAALTWIVLFLWAVITNGGLGSPLAFPMMVLAGLALGAGSVAGALLPATVVAEAVSAGVGLRVWWQVPIAALLVVLATLIGAISYGASGYAPLGQSLLFSVPAAGILLLLLLAYWSALQSTDWLLKTSARIAAKVWPGRFSYLSQPQASADTRSIRGRARFRVTEHFTFYSGQSPVLVISGNVLDGDVHAGMRARTSVGSPPLSATIQSVERTPDGGGSKVGLLLAVSEREMDAWKSAAHEGAVLAIV